MWIAWTRLVHTIRICIVALSVLIAQRVDAQAGELSSPAPFQDEELELTLEPVEAPTIRPPLRPRVQQEQEPLDLQVRLHALEQQTELLRAQRRTLRENYPAPRALLGTGVLAGVLGVGLIVGGVIASWNECFIFCSPEESARADAILARYSIGGALTLVTGVVMVAVGAALRRRREKIDSKALARAPTRNSPAAGALARATRALRAS